MSRHSRTSTFAHTFNPYRRSTERNRRRLAFETLEPRQMLAAFDVLVFGRTTGFRHSSIDEGLATIQALGAANDFSVQYTENAGSFIATNLAPFEAIVFLNTTGDVLNATQQAVFENYIRAGGGFVGVHSAADTEYGWAWYGELLGAYFASHPAIQQATIEVADHAHVSTAHLPERWVRTDEWYNYQVNPRGDVHVLATLDESTYSGGTQGFDHPISWYHYFDGGRSWYTGLGHTEGTYLEPLFQQHLLGGILFAAGQVEADLGATIDANWKKVDLATSLNSPMSLDVAPDGRVFFVERGGAVKVYNPVTGLTSVAAQLNTYSGDEHGLLGIALDPDFESNHWVYLFWSLAGAASDQRLARFTVVGNQLDLASQKVLLTFHTDRGGTNHEAGSLAFGPEGELYLSTGDNTNPFESSGFNPIDERPGRFKFDAQRSAGNMNDLRGKILRIIPQPDGTYTIPAGNLFPADGSAGRPEIYVMGNRNPFRISIDAETGWLYWGEVGPDAGNDSATRGPRGYDEINQARQAGNFGWPYIIAHNQPYRDFDFASGISGALFNPAAPINNSPNNTGSMNLPPANPALIWYPYATSTEFPELGSGGRTAMAGPVYHFDGASESRIKLPEYFDDTLIMYEWSRSQFFEVKLDQGGELLKINRIFSDLSFNRPIDVELGPDGALYVLEWGAQFGGGPDAKLVRVEFLGNRPSVTGDYNRNNTVDAADYVIWRKNLGSTTELSADGNGDRMIDARDHAVWRENFGASLPSPDAAGSAAAATLGTSSIEVGESEMPGQANKKSTSARVNSFITVETSSTWRPSSRPSLARYRNEDLGRYRDDELLLLATDRVWQSLRHDFFEPLHFRNSGDRVDDAPGQIQIDESLALAFELY